MVTPWWNTILNKPMVLIISKEHNFKKLFVDPGYIGDQAAGSRLKGFDDVSSQIIGWYGGDNAKGLQRTTLYAPQVIIKNAECLEVEVSFKATDLSRMIANMGSDALVQVTIASKTREGTTHIVNRNLPGGSAYEVPVNAFLGGGSKVEGKTVRRYITYILDDVTQPNGHFAEQHWCTEDKEDAHALIPGEDIKVQATVFSNTRLANIAKSNESYTNSLFAEMIPGRTAGQLRRQFERQPAWPDFDLPAFTHIREGQHQGPDDHRVLCGYSSRPHRHIDPQIGHYQYARL